MEKNQCCSGSKKSVFAAIIWSILIVVCLGLFFMFKTSVETNQEDLTQKTEEVVTPEQTKATQVAPAQTVPAQTEPVQAQPTEKVKK